MEDSTVCIPWQTPCMDSQPSWLYAQNNIGKDILENMKSIQYWDTYLDSYPKLTHTFVAFYRRWSTNLFITKPSALYVCILGRLQATPKVPPPPTKTLATGGPSPRCCWRRPSGGRRRGRDVHFLFPCISFPTSSSNPKSTPTMHVSTTHGCVPACAVWQLRLDWRDAKYVDVPSKSRLDRNGVVHHTLPVPWRIWLLTDGMRAV